MHEEGHWAPNCYICLLCATVRQDSIGDQWCIGCFHRFDSNFTVGVAGSHILQCELARERSEKFASYDHLCTHIQTRHDIKNPDLQSSAWSFPIESNWPGECGFCGAKFAQWDGRADHIGAHFLRDNTSEVPLQPFNIENKNLQSMAKQGASTRFDQNGQHCVDKTNTETTRCFLADAWNTTCLAKPNVSNIRLEAFESGKG